MANAGQPLSLSTTLMVASIEKFDRIKVFLHPHPSQARAKTKHSTRTAYVSSSGLKRSLGSLTPL
ncbi:hypothetical protein PIIN_11440 [Serendipita indica DSM 11827]|uniref:Uncharacterized protein n=1 Tax=Serendipita indica (strain DSM 11827) TaxID=1109443 RepID=G4U1M0_SERID|nr:hypothetical protein PIIN_11440 [Serendipita indica DSM 11827]